MIKLEPVPKFLESATYDVIFEKMVYHPAIAAGLPRLSELSFGGTMRLLEDHVRPEVFLLTHQSAIPVADCIRSYYEELGVQLPELGIVNTKEAVMDRTLGPQPPVQVLDREVPLLKPLVKGRRVAIIDQYVHDRYTLNSAKQLALAAGAAAVGLPDRVRWYHDARPDDIDLDNLTSVHADHMSSIGRAAAKRLVRKTVS